ncbi:hypothetical protein AWZ03_003749 [Drosophila navojoa]|uniref:Uncharacterized protein n=1 Tax=Drosophila navojoa TaxID=7232 RepID=A0A484BPW2_DRONA|nr:hypothetical protein AWZ03_003749 [Drosophila navojoa]
MRETTWHLSTCSLRLCLRLCLVLQLAHPNGTRSITSQPPDGSGGGAAAAVAGSGGETAFRTLLSGPTLSQRQRLRLGIDLGRNLGTAEGCPLPLPLSVAGAQLPLHP